MIATSADRPLRPYTDYVGPRFAIVMLLAALDQRRRAAARAA
ncbi:MAG: hypothetical protein U1F11_10160 [Steroidobacteraceae bacterium]